MTEEEELPGSERKQASGEFGADHLNDERARPFLVEQNPHGHEYERRLRDSAG